MDSTSYYLLEPHELWTIFPFEEDDFNEIMNMFDKESLKKVFDRLYYMVQVRVNSAMSVYGKRSRLIGDCCRLKIEKVFDKWENDDYYGVDSDTSKHEFINKIWDLYFSYKELQVAIDKLESNSNRCYCNKSWRNWADELRK